jgi:hypothetical protein
VVDPCRNGPKSGLSGFAEHHPEGIDKEVGAISATQERRNSTLHCVKYRRRYLPFAGKNSMIELETLADEITDLERRRLADAGESSVQELPPRVQELIAQCAARPDLQPELKAMLAAYFAALFEEQP